MGVVVESSREAASLLTGPCAVIGRVCDGAGEEHAREYVEESKVRVQYGYFYYWYGKWYWMCAC